MASHTKSKRRRATPQTTDFDSDISTSYYHPSNSHKKHTMPSANMASHSSAGHADAQQDQIQEDLDPSNQQQNPAPNLKRTTSTLNLAVLKRHHPTVTSILSTAPYAAVYAFSPDSSTWEKIGVEGTMFVVQLESSTSLNGDTTNSETDADNDEEEHYAVIVLNRKSLANFRIDLAREDYVEITDEYVIVQGKPQVFTQENDEQQDSNGQGHDQQPAAPSQEQELAIYGLWIFTEPPPSSTSETRNIMARLIHECAVRAEKSRARVAEGRRKKQEEKQSAQLGEKLRAAGLEHYEQGQRARMQEVQRLQGLMRQHDGVPHPEPWKHPVNEAGPPPPMDASPWRHPGDGHWQIHQSNGQYSMQPHTAQQWHHQHLHQAQGPQPGGPPPPFSQQIPQNLLSHSQRASPTREGVHSGVYSSPSKYPPAQPHHQQPQQQPQLQPTSQNLSRANINSPAVPPGFGSMYSAPQPGSGGPYGQHPQHGQMNSQYQRGDPHPQQPQQANTSPQHQQGYPHPQHLQHLQHGHTPSEHQQGQTPSQHQQDQTPSQHQQGFSQPQHGHANFHHQQQYPHPQHGPTLSRGQQGYPHPQHDLIPSRTQQQQQHQPRHPQPQGHAPSQPQPQLSHQFPHQPHHIVPNIHFPSHPPQHQQPQPQPQSYHQAPDIPGLGVPSPPGGHAHLQPQPQTQPSPGRQTQVQMHGGAGNEGENAGTKGNSDNAGIGSDVLGNLFDRARMQWGSRSAWAQRKR
ncbi:MAG: hypothetical protein M1831_003746 [Alyxoria varia]|nr:MAG: hypothetical protein M1831_003746 [Alyxoria varia]